MGRAGRKRKQGRRTPGGQLSRAGRAPTYDRGTVWAAQKFSVYGQDGSDAIGRAFVAGLLGEDADNLKDVARRVFRAYWPMLGVGPAKSCIGAERGSGGQIVAYSEAEHDWLVNREQWLTETLRRIDRMGRPVRRAFDQLVIDVNPDAGPAWLDSLIWHKTRQREPSAADVRSLELALSALREIAC